MNDILKNDLEKLLGKHPELKQSGVFFSESGIYLVQDGNKPEQPKKPLPACKPATELPAILPGAYPGVEIRRSPVHGYGIFAKKMIEEGEMIEQMKLLRLGWRSNYLHDPVLKDYVWANKHCTCDDCQAHGSPQYIALGLGSLYNHSDQPNTEQTLDFNAEIMTIRAKQPIAEGQEIFVNYGQKYWLVRDFWKHVQKNNELQKFHEKNIRPFANRT